MRTCTGDVCVRSTISFGDVERVLHVARGMILRDRERLERVPVGLDLRALGDDEPELREDLHGLEPDLREQVQVTAADRPRRQRDVDDAARGRPSRDVCELAEPRRRELSIVCLDLVRRRADARAFRRRQLAELLHQLGHLALLAEELRLRRADRLLVAERRDHRDELVAELFEVRDQFRHENSSKRKNGDCVREPPS